MIKRAFTFKQVLSEALENRFEHSDKELAKKLGYFSCSPTEFVIRNILAWFFNLKCEACGNTGTYRGYDYEEGCDDCHMMAYRWNFHFWSWLIRFISYEKGLEERRWYEFIKYDKEKFSLG